MIQLANDPNASRASDHSGANDSKAPGYAAQRGRSGHAWPFLSRPSLRPSAQLGPKADAKSAS